VPSAKCYKSEDVHGALGVRSAVNRAAGVLGRPTDTGPGPKTATSAAQKMQRQHAGGRVKSSRRPPRNAAPWYQPASPLRKAEPPYPSNPTTATLHTRTPRTCISSPFPNPPCSVGRTCRVVCRVQYNSTWIKVVRRSTKHDRAAQL
jgi:hypothetical protein